MTTYYSLFIRVGTGWVIHNNFNAVNLLKAKATALSTYRYFDGKYSFQLCDGKKKLYTLSGKGTSK